MSKRAAGKKGLYADVQPEAYETIAKIALATGLTKAEVIETMAANVRIGLDGQPIGWQPNPHKNQQELPLASSA
ncbi:hypothetical protein EHW97_14840 [Aeromicrobium camelliae]|uniref:Uncharacterized protein n=1 Tax=Aeromicrobium camelliae TaxID=1538144 RepID=A0A3N6W3D2_9ACTN|nr:hypothetical protein [Aeromicrobium camelliae]RQN02029.1 hypothetical protein EHW97_14840 [Aeromicrobium camelliae]